MALCPSVQYNWDRTTSRGGTSVALKVAELYPCSDGPKHRILAPEVASHSLEREASLSKF